MTRLIAATLRPARLMAVVAAFGLLAAKSSAIEPYRLPSAKPRNERLDEEKSLKAHKLTPYRKPKVSPYSPQKSARYTRKQEGTQRVAR